MDWPASSPDLKPIENLFGIISRRVYQDGKHFGSVQELKSAILKVWEAIPLQIFEELINYMPKGIGQVMSLDLLHVYKRTHLKSSRYFKQTLDSIEKYCYKFNYFELVTKLILPFN